MALIARLLVFALALVVFTGCTSVNRDVKVSKPASDNDIFSEPSYYAKCDNKLESMASMLEPIAKKLVSQKIPYAQKPANEWRDCSGNFLRLSSYVAEACLGSRVHLATGPGITDYKVGGNNKATPKAKARDSRSLAKWYQDQGRFIPIYYDNVTADITQPSDSLKMNRHRIKPGAVLWFSRSLPTSAGGVNALFARREPGSINHMGTVVSTKLDNEGQLIQYSMYHGRRAGKLATITHTQYWQWPLTYTKGGRKYPPAGYWKQYLVGIGTLLPAEVPPSGIGNRW